MSQGRGCRRRSLLARFTARCVRPPVPKVAAAPSGEVFEEEHLRRSLSSTCGQPAAEVVKRVLDDVHRFTERDDFADDPTLVAVSVRAE